jgi:hypothetical protein
MTAKLGSLVCAASVLAAALLGAACSTAGLNSHGHQVEDFIPGITTVADATALLGPHTSEKGYPNGQRLLQWGSGAASSANPAARRVAILFGEDGRMVGVIHESVQQEAR